ncbi:hypothetical protein D3C72_1660860 [compost metagenome]
MTRAQRIYPLAALEDQFTLAFRNAWPVVIDDDSKVFVGVQGGDLNELQAVFTGIFQHVAHHFHKVVFLPHKGHFRRNIQRDHHTFALIHLVQCYVQAVEQRRDRVDLARQHRLPRIDAGPVQVVTDLLRNTADLVQHDRLDFLDGGLLTGT